MRPLAILPVVVALAVAAGCSSGDDEPNESAATVTTPEVATVQAEPRRAAEAVGLGPVSDGFDAPLLVTAPTGDDRLYVVEQGGLVHIVDQAGRREPTPFLDLRDRVAPGGERGLLGLAFHPDYQSNGRLFVDYTDSSGTTRVVEHRVDRQSGAVDDGREILAVEQPFANHNGGNLVFGPDGLLHVGLGDGGSGGDPEGNGQNTDTLLGSILRLDVDSGGEGVPYAIPPDNPFADGGGRPEIYVYGLRNPWRFSYDDPTGDLWIGDVGQGSLEEVDRLPAGEIAGANLGWNAFEGTASFSGAPVADHVPPVAEYGRAEGCSITGGFVGRDPAVPGIEGRYVYGDFCSGRIWTLDAGAASPEPVEITDQIGEPLTGLTSFGRDDAGRLYAVADGAVHRFIAAPVQAG
ncbi:MAG: PQQ-dependent sugar dehydrogenase [Miltoncostaeaceae bacterium]